MAQHDLSVADLNGKQKVAILVISLGQQVATKLLKLLAEDEISLVVYDGVVDVVFPRSKVGDAAVVTRAKADSIEPRGMTNLGGGLVAGVQQLAQDAAGLHRVFLVSDGLANVGVTDPVGLEDIARQALRRDLTVSTFGVGQDYDEELLRRIADAGGGSYYYIAQPDQIPGIFEEELGEFSAVVAQNLTVDLVAQGAQVRGVLGFEGVDLPAAAGDVLAGATRSVLVALSVPPLPEGGTKLGTVSCRWTPVETPLSPEEVTLELAALASHDLARVGGRSTRTCSSLRGSSWSPTSTGRPWKPPGRVTLPSTGAILTRHRSPWAPWASSPKAPPPSRPA